MKRTVNRRKSVQRSFVGVAAAVVSVFGITAAAYAAPTTGQRFSDSVGAAAPTVSLHADPSGLLPVSPANEGSFVSDISDAQLSDCLLKIAEIPYGAVDGVSPSKAFDEFARLKSTLYYEHPDAVGFGTLTNGQAVMEGNTSADFLVAVPPEQSPQFDSLSARLEHSLGLDHVDLVATPGTATVRTVCAVFLDAMNNEPLAGMQLTTTIDQPTNQVVVGVLEGNVAVATKAAADRYGGLVRVVTAGETIEESCNATDPATGAGTGLWRADYQHRWCTQGFTIRNRDSNAVYATTAAHCSPVGTGTASTWFVSGGIVGSTSGNLVSSQMDVAFIANGSYSNYVWRGATNTNTKGTVFGALTGTPPIGAYAGESGSTTGESYATYGGRAGFGSDLTTELGGQ